MDQNAIIFNPTGEIQTYFVPITGGYLIEACGAQAAPNNYGHSEAKGDYIRGMFYLNRGDVLKILVGSQRRPDAHARRMTCAGEGGTIVWRGAGELPIPAKLLLAAGGGDWADSDFANAPGWGASFNAGAFQVNQHAVHGAEGYVTITPVQSATGPSTPPPTVSREPWAAAGELARPVSPLRALFPPPFAYRG